MGIYITLRCPYCGFVLYFGEHVVGIGDPQIECPSCANTIELPHLGEWDHLTFWEKLIRFLAILRTAFVFGGAPAFIAYMFVFVGNNTEDITRFGVFFSWCIGMAIVGGFLLLRHWNDAGQSRKRVRASEWPSKKV